MKKLTALILALLMLVSLMACSATQDTETAETAETGTEETAATEETSTASSEDPLWFAFASSLTVENADYGEEQLAALEMAVEQINAAGGINGREVKFDVFDDQGNANEAVNCADKIVADGKYEFVIGYNSSNRLMAANAVYEPAGIPVICVGGTAATVTEQGYSNVLRICPRDDVAIGVVVKAAAEIGMEKCVVICDNTEGEISWYEGSVPYFEDYGIEVVDVQKVETSERDYSSVITNWLKEDFDTIYLCQNYDHAALFLNQAQSLGLLEGKHLVSAVGSCNVPQFFDLVPDEITNGMLIQTCISVSDPSDPAWLQFNEDYTAYTGKTAGEPSVNTYAGIMAVVDCMNQTGATRDNLIEIMQGMEFSSILGTIVFDEKGDNTGCQGGVFEAQNGECEFYSFKNQE